MSSDRNPTSPGARATSRRRLQDLQDQFVEATHPRTGALKRFSLIECVDWANIISSRPTIASC
jgi:hypothetical protein